MVMHVDYFMPLSYKFAIRNVFIIPQNRKLNKNITKWNSSKIKKPKLSRKNEQTRI